MHEEPRLPTLQRLVSSFIHSCQELGGRVAPLVAESWAILVTAVGGALNFLALTMVWVGFIETFKRALGSVLSLVWGRLVFAETIDANKMIAVLLMALGVGLILW